MPDAAKLIATAEAQLKILSVKVAALEKTVAALQVAATKGGHEASIKKIEADLKALEAKKKDKATADQEAQKLTNQHLKMAQDITAAMRMEARLKTIEAMVAGLQGQIKAAMAK